MLQPSEQQMQTETPIPYLQLSVIVIQFFSEELKIRQYKREYLQALTSWSNIGGQGQGMALKYSQSMTLFKLQPYSKYLEESTRDIIIN